MGTARALRRRAGRLRIEELRAAAHTGARLAGCTCRPDLEVLHHGRGEHHGVVSHDSSCPAVDAGTQWLVIG
jgi:hypothetical protein